MEHAKLIFWPGLLWFIFTVSIFLVPYLSVVFTKQLAFLITTSTFIILSSIVFIAKRKIIFYKLKLSSLVLAFLAYAGIVAWVTGILNYNFWDLGLFVDIHPYVLFVASISLLFMVFILAQFKDAPKHFLTVLPCIIVIWDFLGIILKYSATYIGKMIGVISINLGQMYEIYFKRYGSISLYPDSSFWLLVHVLGILILVPLLVRDYNRNNKSYFVGRFILLVILSWFLTYPISNITFAYLWGIFLGILGVTWVVKSKFGLLQGVISGIFVALLVVSLLVFQHLLGTKNIYIDPKFWGNANLVAAYKTYDKAIRAQEILPGLFKGSVLQNLLLGLSIGKLGPLMGILNFALAHTAYNGLEVLLIETGILGFSFWVILTIMLLRGKNKNERFSLKLSKMAAILLMLWQAFTGVSIWALFLLYLIIFLIDVLQGRTKFQEIKLTTDRPVPFLFKFSFYSIAVLGTVVLIFNSLKAFSIVKGMYAVKLREVQAASLKGTEQFKKLEEAFYYTQQMRMYCTNCKLLDISALQILNRMDDLLTTSKDIVKALNIDVSYVEQLRYYMLTETYKLMGDVIIPDANTITAYVLDKLGTRQNSKLLQNLALVKYDQAINITPTNYTLAYRYAKLLLLQESKKGDVTYSRLLSLFKLLAGLATNSPSRTIDLALLQGQFYIKYKEYEKAKTLYTKVKDWISRQNFKNGKDKKTWLKAMNDLIQKVNKLEKTQQATLNKKEK